MRGLEEYLGRTTGLVKCRGSKFDLARDGCSVNVLINKGEAVTAQGPIHLAEDGETGDRFLVYESGSGTRLDIRFEGETLWMTQEQIARLFGRERTVITKHIANVLEEGELNETSTVQKMHTTSGRPPLLYSLDMIISVGYRVSSAQATLFRRWATGVLVQFAKSGFMVDSVRLRNPTNADRIAELRVFGATACKARVFI